MQLLTVVLPVVSRRPQFVIEVSHDFIDEAYFNALPKNEECPKPRMTNRNPLWLLCEPDVKLLTSLVDRLTQRWRHDY